MNSRAFLATLIVLTISTQALVACGKKEPKDKNLAGELTTIDTAPDADKVTPEPTDEDPALLFAPPSPGATTPADVSAKPGAGSTDTPETTPGVTAGTTPQATTATTLPATTPGVEPLAPPTRAPVPNSSPSCEKPFVLEDSAEPEETSLQSFIDGKDGVWTLSGVEMWVQIKDLETEKTTDMHASADEVLGETAAIGRPSENGQILCHTVTTESTGHLQSSWGLPNAIDRKSGDIALIRTVMMKAYAGDVRWAARVDKHVTNAAKIGSANPPVGAVVTVRSAAEAVDQRTAYFKIVRLLDGATHATVLVKAVYTAQGGNQKVIPQIAH